MPSRDGVPRGEGCGGSRPPGAEPRASDRCDHRRRRGGSGGGGSAYIAGWPRRARSFRSDASFGGSQCLVQASRGRGIGVAGLVGAGRSELARLLFGGDRREAEEIRLEGKLLPAYSPAEASKWGIGLVPEERSLQHEPHLYGRPAHLGESAADNSVARARARG